MELFSSARQKMIYGAVGIFENEFFQNTGMQQSNAIWIKKRSKCLTMTKQQNEISDYFQEEDYSWPS